jgi:hypothetical protein
MSHAKALFPIRLFKAFLSREYFSTALVAVIMISVIVSFPAPTY